jgi:hypothetical protein
MNTLAKLYLGSEPIAVHVEDDQLVVSLADERSLIIPLAFVSQVGQLQPLPAEAQLLILRQPPQVDHVRITDSTLNVYLTDGRLLSCPLAWFPRLLHGSPAERNHYELSGDDEVIHWPDLDEDIELSRLFAGGKSVESEQSLQRWLLSRQTQATPELAINQKY